MAVTNPHPIRSHHLTLNPSVFIRPKQEDGLRIPDVSILKNKQLLSLPAQQFWVNCEELLYQECRRLQEQNRYVRSGMIGKKYRLNKFHKTDEGKSLSEGYAKPSKSMNFVVRPKEEKAEKCKTTRDDKSARRKLFLKRQKTFHTKKIHQAMVS